MIWNARGLNATAGFVVLMGGRSYKQKAQLIVSEPRLTA
jgi:hypothetical protein